LLQETAAQLDFCGVVEEPPSPADGPIQPSGLPAHRLSQPEASMHSRTPGFSSAGLFFAAAMQSL
jgi:hypothetical protein